MSRRLAREAPTFPLNNSNQTKTKPNLVSPSLILVIERKDPSVSDEAFRFFVRTGIVTGSNYTDDSLCKPYPIAPCHKDPNTKKKICPKGPTDNYKCVKKCKIGYSAETYKNDHYFGKDISYFSLRNDEAIADLIANGPIVAAFDVYEDFMKYKGGIYEYTAGKFVGGHAVRIVGYGSENGVDYWTVANSWDWLVVATYL